MPDPLVLLPGLQSDDRSWFYQLEHFGRSRQVIVPKGQQYCASIAEMTDVVFEQLPERFHLAAWSMGGYIALAMMPRLLGRMASLILVGTSARPEDPASTPRRRDLLALAEREGIEVASLRSSAHSTLDIEAVAPEVRAGLLLTWTELGLDAYRKQQHAIIERPDTRANLALVDCPTLIIVGEADQTTPPDCAREMHAAIPGSHLHVIERSGHCVPFERPELFNQILDDWLLAQDHAEGEMRRQQG